MERLFLKYNPVKRNFSFYSLKDEQIDAVHLLRSKDLVAIGPTGFEESLIYQLLATAKEIQMCEWHPRMLKQIKEMKELGIPSIAVSTKDDALLLIGEAKFTLKFSEDSGGLFGRKIL